MCRFIAYLGPARTLESLLVDPPRSLLRQSFEPRLQRQGTVNADGFGVGWYDVAIRPEPARHRTARPMWADRSFASWAGLVSSGAVLAAVRSATPPLPVEDSGTPPFTAESWLFAFNGAVDGFRGPVGGRLRHLVSDRRAGQIEGASDSEVLFALALDRLDAGAPPGEALSAVTETVLEVSTGRLNLVLTDGHRMAATACGDSLYVLSRTGLAGHGVIVASEPHDEEPGWERVDDGSVVTASAEKVTLAPLPAVGRATPVWTPVRTTALSVDVHLGPADLAESLRQDARRGLAAHPKQLPPKWFYDEVGSQLFEAITRLPEYYPSRCERRILMDRAADVAALTGADTVVELGSGTSEKTRLLLDALFERGSLRRFVPLDVSEVTLRSAGAAIALAYPGVHVTAVVGDFERHLGVIPSGGRRLVAFLGGTIGNLDPSRRQSFLSQLAAGLSSDDFLLLGTDLVKDPSRLEAAYDDAMGVTAAFNRNLLAVLNRELGATFDLTRFAHVARWEAEAQWVEMRLRSTVSQSVRVAALDMAVPFADGEEMRTEISAKFHRSGLEGELDAAGLEMAAWWTDPAGDFALSLSSPR